MSGKFIQKKREALGYTQKQFAQETGVNFRSLQDYEQGHKPVESIKGEVLLRLSRGLNCSIEEILLEDVYSQKPEEYAKRMLAYHEKFNEINLYGEYYRFPVVYENKYIDMARIHPLKQMLVNQINKEMSPDNNVIAIMLFGSSVTMRCNQSSDIDLAVRLADDACNTKVKNEVSERIQEICDWNADIIWFDRISKEDRIYHDICKGVQIV